MPGISFRQSPKYEKTSSQLIGLQEIEYRQTQEAPMPHSRQWSAAERVTWSRIPADSRMSSLVQRGVADQFT